MTFYEAVVPAVGPDTHADTLARRYRNTLLARCDWTQLPDASCDRQAWADYRQLLRDMPADPNWPNVEVPDPPA